MADLTGKTLANGYPNLVTIGATTDDNPTTGTLENGKGNTITRVSIGDVDSGGKLSVSGGTAAIGIVTEDWVNLTSGTRIESRLASSTGNTYGRIQVTDGGGLSAANLILQPDSGNVGIRKTTAAKELDVNGEIRASGGILFGSDTAAANTLDDYEEGTWAPLYEPFIGSFTSITMDILHATYTKIGNIVHLSCLIRTDAIDTTGGSSTVIITGAPFTPDQTSVGFIAQQSGWTTNYPTVCEIDTNSRIYLRTGNGSGSSISAITPSNMTNAADSNRVGISITYQTS